MCGAIVLEFFHRERYSPTSRILKKSLFYSFCYYFYSKIIFIIKVFDSNKNKHTLSKNMIVLPIKLTLRILLPKINYHLLSNLFISVM